MRDSHNRDFWREADKGDLIRGTLGTGLMIGLVRAGVGLAIIGALALFFG